MPCQLAEGLLTGCVQGSVQTPLLNTREDMRMKKEIILTPEELYFMGVLLQAKYIDYAYVVAMGDIQQKRGIYESESREKLAEKGILMEDFSGNLEVDEEAGKLLEPVFFGNLESFVDVVLMEGEGRRILPGRRFHFREGRITSTVMGKEGIFLEAVDEGWIQTWVAGFLPEDYAREQAYIPVAQINRENISRIITVKSTLVGEKSAVEIYVEADGSVFAEKADGQAMVLSKEQFGLEVYRGLRGE